MALAALEDVQNAADERHVTMQAFDSPVFVEDVVRNVAASLMSDQRITWFSVRAVNQESIHNHDAFAELEWFRSTSTHTKGTSQDELRP